MLNSTKLIFSIALSVALFASSAIANNKCVILLHGLARSEKSMASLAAFLKRNNFIVTNATYSSTAYPIDVLANHDLANIVDTTLKKNCDKLHFVTHSLGGIVLLKYLEKHNNQKISHIVMLGPPIHGSKLADLLHRNILFKFVTGPAGQELTTFKKTTSTLLPSTKNYSIGVIAGNVSFTPFNKCIFKEANDGKVAISNTQWPDMKDFILLPVSHTFMMNNARAKVEILNFLNNGKFTHR